MEFNCPRCEESFKRKDYLIAHLNRKNECNASASNASRQSIIDKLMTKEHTVPTYECEFCTKTFILSYKSRHTKSEWFITQSVNNMFVTNWRKTWKL